MEDFRSGMSISKFSFNIPAGLEKCVDSMSNGFILSINLCIWIVNSYKPRNLMNRYEYSYIIDIRIIVLAVCIEKAETKNVEIKKIAKIL